MKCEEVYGRLDEYVDGMLPEAELQELERHLRACPACREEEALLRSLLAQAAALPKEMEPPRDLWPGIAERVGGRKVVPFLRAAAPSPWWSPAGLAAAAAVLIALGTALRTQWTPGSPAPGGAGTAVAPAAGVHRASLEDEPSDVLDAERDYVRATSRLMATLDDRRDDLAPETVKAVEDNLKTIDDALKQIRKALTKDPANARLTRMLTTTHQRKVDLLRRVVRLSKV